MKLTDIIETSDPYRKLIWCIIQQEFDTLLKPIGQIENEKIKEQWIKDKLDSMGWILAQPYAGVEDITMVTNKDGDQMRVLTFAWCCDFIGVTPKTLLAIYDWSKQNNFTYFPVSVDFKNIKISKSISIEATPEPDHEPEEVEKHRDELPDDIFTEERKVADDDDADPTGMSLVNDDHFYIKDAINTMMATASADGE